MGALIFCAPAPPLPREWRTCPSSCWAAPGRQPLGKTSGGFHQLKRIHILLGTDVSRGWSKLSYECPPHHMGLVNPRAARGVGGSLHASLVQLLSAQFFLPFPLQILLFCMFMQVILGKHPSCYFYQGLLPGNSILYSFCGRKSLEAGNGTWMLTFSSLPSGVM